MQTAPIERNWRITETPLGTEITFSPTKQSSEFLVPLIAGVMTALACSYGIYTLLRDWYISGEVLAGAVVLIVIFAAGLFLARYWVRLALRSETYRLSSTQLTVTSTAPRRMSKQSVDRDRIKEILQLYTLPPKAAGQSGAWRTCVAYNDRTSDKRQELFLEGDSEEVSNMLTAYLSEWAKVPCKRENTAD